MPSLREFCERTGIPLARRWTQVYAAVAEDRALANEARILRAERASEEKPMDSGINVDWRAVAYNAPSRTMPNPTPWVHGLIRDSTGPSPRIQLAPRAGGGIIDLLFIHPDQAAAETMDWDLGAEMTVDGHVVAVRKGMTVAADWHCEGDESGLVWQLQAALAPDHPLVLAAAEAAKGPQEALDQAERDFDAYAQEWGDKNFPHPDFMNVVRELELSEWKHAPGYWPGDPRPDADTLLEKAREQLRGG